jgi:hypothetical protein
VRSILIVADDLSQEIVKNLEAALEPFQQSPMP